MTPIITSRQKITAPAKKIIGIPKNGIIKGM